MATKKKAAAKKAPAKKKAPKRTADTEPTPAVRSAPKRYRRRPPTWTATTVEAGLPDDTLRRWAAEPVLHVQSGEFVGLNIPGHGRARTSDVVLESDDGAMVVCAQQTFLDQYEELT